MSESTFDYLTDALIGEIALHPHQEELLSIMQEQLIDDTNVYVQNFPWFVLQTAFCDANYRSFVV